MKHLKTFESIELEKLTIIWTTIDYNTEVNGEYPGVPVLHIKENILENDIQSIIDSAYNYVIIKGEVKKHSDNIIFESQRPVKIK